MMNWKKTFLSVSLVSSLVVSSFGGISKGSSTAEAASKKEELKNIIFMVGDGMGVPYMTALRYWHDDPSTTEYEKTAFDPYLVGLQTTYPIDEEHNITDSASAATAMSGGVKTYNGAIALDNDKSEVKTVLEQAKENGMSTGLVATSQINHATPAAYASHDESRKNYDQIADDYYDDLIDGKHKIDVILGGGTSYFVREDRNIAELFEADGYSYVTSRNELLNDNNDQILGLFAPKGMDKMIDRAEDIPSLREMTKAAIDRLSEDQDGFFLMIEGSQIDWAGHDNDTIAAMSEMIDFEEAFKEVIDFAKQDGETLVVVTADHSTGGFSIGADGVYNFFIDPIKAAKRTPDFMANEIINEADIEETLNEFIELELTLEEIQSVKDAAEVDEEERYSEIDNAIEDIFNKRSLSGWTTDGHTGEEVPVYAFGPEKDRFVGLIDNTDNAKRIFELLQRDSVENSDSTESAAIEDLTAKRILPIDTEDKLKLDQKITRGEVALLLQRALDLEVSDNKAVFKDVSESHPYAEAIAAVTEAGIFQGYGNGEFGVNEKLTNEQLIVVFEKAFQKDISNEELEDDPKHKVSIIEFAVALSNVLDI
ncbi:alkaline phosphatase [Chengkuizengella sediminis]|uniref:alkaline phosphatase n=1 Tax=Chengkuizengella sediminis TaxID=1885917 RepID=UPI0013896C86|nr:alkaline phosphatase [Chengkuizengella sediminis]